MAKSQGYRWVIVACVVCGVGVLAMVILLVATQRQGGSQSVPSPGLERKEGETTRQGAVKPVLLQEKTTPDIVKGKYYYAFQLADGFVVRVGDRVTFLDSDGQMRKGFDLRPGSAFGVSPGGQFVAWNEPAHYDEEKGACDGPGTFQVLSSQGQPLWTLKTENVFVPIFYVESGKILGMGVTGEIPIVGREGFEKALPAPSQGTMSPAVAIPGKGTYLARFVREDGHGQPLQVMLNDDKGNCRYRTNLEDVQAWGLRVFYLPGDEAPSVLAMTQSINSPGQLGYQIWRLNGAGKVLWRVPGSSPGNRHIDLSNDQRHFVTYATHDLIECYDVSTGELRWRWEEGVRNRAVLKTAFSPDDRYLLASASWYERDRPHDRRSDGPRKVFLFDARDGRLLWKQEFDGKNYEGEWERSPLVRFRDNDTFEVFDVPNRDFRVFHMGK